MVKIKFIGIAIFFLLGFIANKEALSWDDEKTHKDLSEFASENSVLSETKGNYLKNLGFDKGLMQELKWGEKKLFVKKWIAEGAQLEDSASWSEILFGDARFDNHFHNPLKPWTEAGLTDLKTGESSLLWAQDGTYQQTFKEGDWSWQKIRDYYYLALTSSTVTQREEYFAKTFRGLGHQIHLIQDAAQPDHVRNDAHPFTRNKFGGLTIEAWAKEKYSFINSLASNPVFPEVSLNISYNGLVPITQFLDTDQYNGTSPSTSLTQGIAEYTNANFASDDTIFTENLPTTDKHYFPYPKKSSTNLQNLIDKNILPEPIIAEDGITDVTLYIKKERDGEVINRFVKPRYTTTSRWDLVGGGYIYELDFYRDEICYEEYATKLIPRAVGYSTGLLNYFFRGDINMVPDEVAGSGYVIVNTTEDDMDGTFELYYDNTNNERVQLWNYSFALGSLSSGNNKSSNINFTPPNDAKEPGKYMLVFKGRLGNEEDAVVGKRFGGKKLAIIYKSYDTWYSALVKIYETSDCSSYYVNKLGIGQIVTDFNPTEDPYRITGNVIRQKSYIHNNDKIYLFNGYGLEIDNALINNLHNEILDRYALVDFWGTMLFHPRSNNIYYLSDINGPWTYVTNDYIILGSQVVSCNAGDGSSCSSDYGRCWHYWIYNYDPQVSSLTKNVDTCMLHSRIGNIHHFTDDGKAYFKALFSYESDWYDDLWTRSMVDLGVGFLGDIPPWTQRDPHNSCVYGVYDVLLQGGLKDYTYFCLNDNTDYIGAVRAQYLNTGNVQEWISDTNIMNCLNISSIIDIKWMGFLE